MHSGLVSEIASESTEGSWSGYCIWSGLMCIMIHVTGHIRCSVVAGQSRESALGSRVCRESVSLFCFIHTCTRRCNITHNRNESIIHKSRSQGCPTANSPATHICELQKSAINPNAAYNSSGSCMPGVSRRMPASHCCNSAVLNVKC
jgi:hypothetical protein